MIQYVHSATVTVKDQDRALHFYVDVLGFEKRQDSPFGENSRWIVVAPPGGQAGLALLRPEDQGKPAGSEGGYTGISFVTDDVQRTYDELSAKGVQFQGPPQRMPWGDLAVWFNDTDGNGFFLTVAGR